MSAGYRSQRSPKEERDERVRRWLLFSVVALVVAVLAVVFLVCTARDVNPAVGQDLCPTDREPTEEIVVIFDATDRWNAVQRSVITRYVQRIQNDVPRFARLSLFRVSTSTASDIPQPELQLCNPGRLEDLGDLQGRLFANPDSIEKRWQTGFASRLISMIPRDTTSERPSSYIMETVRGAAVELFGKDENAAGGRIILFSDLLQNSRAYSHYRDPSWERASGERLANLDELGTSFLEGVRVEVYLLDRPPVGESEGHSRGNLIEFWDGYFTSQDARLIRVRRVEG